MDVSTQPGQIFMGTTGRLSSLRQNITGGGNLIGFSIRLKRPKLLQVLSFLEKCNLLKKTIFIHRTGAVSGRGSLCGGRLSTCFVINGKRETQ